MSAPDNRGVQKSELASDNWIGRLPNRWVTARIKHGFRTIGSGTTPPSNQEEFYGGEIPWVNTSELRENTVTSTETTVTSAALHEFSALKIYPKNSVLFAMYGATIGRVAILGVEATVNQAVCVLADPSKFSASYVFYGLQASRVVLESIATGGGQPNLNAEKVREHKLPCPPIADQTVIANYLDRETTRIDGLIAEKERMLALLEEKRAALISRLVTCGLDPKVRLKPSGQEWLGDVPAHWGLERLKFHLRRIEQGWSPQCDNSPAEACEWGVLKVGAVNAWAFNASENKRLPDEIEPLLEYEIRPGDVLMSRANTTQLLGSVSYVQDVNSKLLLCDKLYRLDVDDATLDREYLVAFMRARPGRFQLEREASGTSGSMQNIGQDTVQNAWVTIPPLGEQEAISSHIKHIREKTSMMEEALRNSVDLLAERRAALITAAVTGQIPLAEMRP